MMNGHTFDANGPASIVDELDPIAKAAVALLDDTIRQVRAGQLRTVAVVAVGPHGFGSAFAGPQACELNMAMDQAKAQLLAALTNPQQRSPIIRPR